MAQVFLTTTLTPSKNRKKQQLPQMNKKYLNKLSSSELEGLQMSLDLLSFCQVLVGLGHCMVTNRS